MRRSRRILLVALAFSWLATACGVVTDRGALTPADPRVAASAAPPPAPAAAITPASSTPARQESAPNGGPVDPTSTAGSAPPTTSAPTSTPAPAPSPTPSRVYGCAPGPCPRTLEYGVNGCTCAGQVYDEESVSAAHCCASGFSDSPCPESDADESAHESTFGSTRWEVESELVTVELKGWPIRVHAKAEAAFRRVAERLESVDYAIVEPIESYNWRVVEGSNVMSSHSFGVAIDVNPGANPCCGVTQWCRCLNDRITDLPPDFVQAFKDAGFEWGGDWADHPDPMHFEWVGWR